MAKIIEFYIPSSFRKKATDSRRWYLSHGSEVLLVNADTVSKREKLEPWCGRGTRSRTRLQPLSRSVRDSGFGPRVRRTPYAMM